MQIGPTPRALNMPDHSHLKPPPFVAHALMRAASALVPTLGLPTATSCRASAPPLPPAPTLLMNRLDYNRLPLSSGSQAPSKTPRLPPPLRASALKFTASAFRCATTPKVPCRGRLSPISPLPAAP